MTRVVITGLGAVSPIGLNRREHHCSLLAGTSAIGPLPSLESLPLKSKIGAESSRFEPASHFGPSSPLLKLDRFAQLGLVAAREAVVDSGLQASDRSLSDASIFVGSAVGGQTTEDHQFSRLYGQETTRVHPLTVPKVMANAAAAAISGDLGIHGPAFTISSACCSSAQAIQLAYNQIKFGLSSVALSGGAEAPLSFGHLKAWEALRVVSSDTCRPFSRGRSGTVLGEGGAFLVLESLEHASDRGAEIHAEIIGVASTTDAGHLTRPTTEGPLACMLQALRAAQIPPTCCDYINSHGTGTVLNDKCEAIAIKSAFGKTATTLPVSSTKSLHGHTLGAAGALEAVATIISLIDGFIPPTANYRGQDPDCPIRIVSESPLRRAVIVALSNSFAFGGQNSTLIFRKWHHT